MEHTVLRPSMGVLSVGSCVFLEEHDGFEGALSIPPGQKLPWNLCCFTQSKQCRPESSPLDAIDAPCDVIECPVLLDEMPSRGCFILPETLSTGWLEVPPAVPIYTRVSAGMKSLWVARDSSGNLVR